MDGGKRTFELLRPVSPEDWARRHGQFKRATIFGASDRGRVRENNEDQFLVAQLERTVVLEQTGFKGSRPSRITDEPPARLMMVADGMGGHEAGEVASSVVVDAMTHYAFSMMPWLGAAGRGDRGALEELRKAVEHAQGRIVQVARRKGLSPALGTTLTMAYVSWPVLYVVHVGDSRAYLHRDGELFRLTTDHNLAEEMVRRGVLTEEQARGSSFTSTLTNAICGELGDDELEVELHRFELELGDRFLLCTDGLYGEIAEDDIASRLDLVLRDEHVEPCVRSLIAAANRAGGNDNVTAVLALF